MIGNMIAVDTETILDGGSHKLWLGTAVYRQYRHGRRVKERATGFTRAVEFWDWLHGQSVGPQPLWVWAHNAGFDFRILGLWKEVDRGRLRLLKATPHPDSQPQPVPAPVLNSPPFLLQFYDKAGRRVKVVDTLNYYRCSLAELGRSVDKPKLAMPDKHPCDRCLERLDEGLGKRVHPKCLALAQQWLTYCERDARIVADAVEWLVQLHRELGLPYFNCTGPGMAWQLFHRKHHGNAVSACAVPEVRELEHRSLYAGQTVVGARGDVCGKVWHLDMQAFYPSVMLSGLFPAELTATGAGQWVPRPLQADSLLPYVARCVVGVRGDGYPRRKQGRVEYPSDTYETVLAGPELVGACKRGHLRQIKEHAVYRLAPIFASYVDQTWRGRVGAVEHGDRAAALVWKMLANSLFGRFASRHWQWESVEREPGMPRWGQWQVTLHGRAAERFAAERDMVNQVDGTGDGATLVIWYRAMAGAVQRRTRKAWTDGAFPAIAAFVTSYGREVMRGLRRIAEGNVGKGLEQAGSGGNSSAAGSLQGTVFYQGTDSLFVDQSGYENLDRAGWIAPGTLGKLRVVAVATGAWFGGQGCWTHAGRVTRQGLKRSARQLANGQWSEDQWESCKNWLADPLRETVRFRTLVKEVEGM